MTTGSARACGVLLLLGCAARAAAEEPVVRAEVSSPRIGVDDVLELTLTLEGPGTELAEEPRVPALQNLSVVGGPSVSTQVSIVNGALTQSRAYTWALQARAKGPAEVGAFHVKLRSAEKATAPIALEVVAGSAQPAPRRAQPLDPFGGEDPFARLFGRRRRPSAPPKLRMEASLSRATAYVGEPIVLSYSVLSDEQAIVTDHAFAEAPQYPGFWSEDLPRAQQRPGGEPVTIDGERYRRVAILQRLLFPTRAGTLDIPPARSRLAIARGPGLFLEPGGVVERQTEALTVNVMPLPVDGFGGAVGSFQVSASLDRPSLSLGEAATLRFRVEGRGNLKWIDQAPDVAVPGAKVYPPQTKADLQVTPAGMSGSKTWEFVVVPETGGSLEVPALPFSYFDPEARRVVSVASQRLSLQVEGAASAAGSAAGTPPNVPAASQGGRLPLRSELEAGRALVPRLAPQVLALALAGTLLGHALLWGSAAWRDRRRSAAGTGTPRRTLRASLAQLERVARGGLSKEGAAALVEKTLHDVFGSALDGSGPAASERDRELRDLLEAVRFVRYAPQLGDYSEKVRELAGRAAEAVRRWA